MFQIALAALGLGALGSFHCIGMCGPLALSLPLNGGNMLSRFLGSLLYNIGRIITYSCFGLLFGIIGKSIAFFGFQQWVSVILGILILTLIILPRKLKFTGANNQALIILGTLRGSLGKLFSRQNLTSVFFIGLLNGLLPCGLVYMAAAGAVSMGSISGSVLFMAFFGLGTLPMMWSVAFFGNCISINIRNRIRSAYPYMMAFIGCMLILRGMGLGLPNISPKLNKESRMVQSCGSKMPNP